MFSGKQNKKKKKGTKVKCDKVNAFESFKNLKMDNSEDEKFKEGKLDKYRYAKARLKDPPTNYGLDSSKKDP